LAAGMDEFLSKPVRAADLLLAIERVSGHTAGSPMARPKSAEALAEGEITPRADSGGATWPPAMILIDQGAVLAACGGDAVILGKLCKTLKARLPLHLQAVREAVQAQDAATLRESAHRVRGMIAAFSTVIGAVAADLEGLAAHGQMADARLVGS